MVTIERMLLQVTGYSPDDAHRLGDEVARRVDAGLASRSGQAPAAARLGGLDLRLRVPAGLSPDELAERIAAQILEQLP